MNAASATPGHSTPSTWPTLGYVNPFRRSARFGLIGVFVTAALVAFVALNYGQGEANPKGALAAIFIIIGVYVFVLLALQSRDLSAAEAADVRGRAAAPPRITNPATMEEPRLWAALAVYRIDAGAVRARKAMWGAARESLRTGMLVCALIFLTVPPIYLLESFVPLLIGGPADRRRGAVEVRGAAGAGGTDGSDVRRHRPRDGASRPGGRGEAAGVRRAQGSGTAFGWERRCGERWC